MNKLNLKFTAKDIAKIEDNLNNTFESIMASFRMSSLIEFLKVGLEDLKNKSEEEISNEIDNLIHTYGKINIQMDILDSLMDAGFLPHNIDTNQIRKNIQEATLASVQPGENTSQTQ